MARCKICRASFTRKSLTHKCCSPECAYVFAVKEREAKEKKLAVAEMKARKEKLKTRSDYIKEAQAAFNEYIRLRDKDDPCISCGRFHQGQYHAGHYRTTKAAPELRFNEYNVNKQCMPCNTHLSGNIVEYRLNLINKIGLENVNWLESYHEPQNLKSDDIKAIRDLYRAKTKALKQAEKMAA